MNASGCDSLTRPWGRMAIHEWPGADPAFLFLHGNGCAASDWDRIRPHLDGSPHAWAIDFPGHGASDIPGRAYSMSDLVEDTLALIEARRLRNLILVGHSLGGMVGIAVAHRSPAIAALILLEGWTSRAAWDAFSFGEHHYGSLLPDEIVKIQKNEALVELRIPDSMRESFGVSLCAFDGFTMLRDLAVPVAELYGTAGRREDTIEQLAIPKISTIKMHWLEDAGHFLHYEFPTEVGRVCTCVRKDIAWP